MSAPEIQPQTTTPTKAPYPTFDPLTPENLSRYESWHDQLELPPSYTYASSITIDDFLNLYHAVYENSDPLSRSLVGSQLRPRQLYVDRYNIAVADSTERIVGFGALWVAFGIGSLGNLRVAPDHQHQGIGRAITAGHVAVAEALELKTLVVPAIESTNTLSDYYAQLGFRQTRSGMRYRGRRPIGGQRPLAFFLGY